MAKTNRKFSIKPLASSLFLGFLLSISLPVAAFGSAADNNKSDFLTMPAVPESQPPDDASVCTDATAKPLNISYVMFKDLKNAEPEPAQVVQVKFSIPAALKTRSPQVFPALPLPRASTAPMTAGEKFNYFLQRSITTPGPYITSIASGLWNEALDNNVGKEDTLDDYFADAMTRAARSFGNRIANNFFEKFAFATILKQDPRYHRSGKSGAGAKIGYALSRLFITQGDRSGDQPNISFLAGGIAGAAVSNYWQREEKQGASHVFKRWGNHLLITGLSNILREFLGGQ